MHPRYLIFGSGSAVLSWGGTGAGEIAVAEVGSNEVSPLSGPGSYRVHVRPHGTVSWTVRIEQLGEHTLDSRSRPSGVTGIRAGQSHLARMPVGFRPRRS